MNGFQSLTHATGVCGGLLGMAPTLTYAIGAQGGRCTSCTWEEAQNAPRGAMERPGSDAPAYMMFTSGSTGTPKGMVHTHASGLSYRRAATSLYDMRASDRIGLHAGLPAEMSQLIAPLSSILYSVPFALTQMLESGALDKRDMSALRWVVYGGEAFAPAQMRALMQLWPQGRFSNNYGPAEVNAVTYMHVSRPQEVPDAGVPIGRVFPHTMALWVDDQDQRVAQGDAGELLFATEAMMQGYWRDPERNAGASVSMKGQRYYRSGDIAVEQDGGVYHMLGRKDRQIKVCGARVELDEIELAINAHPDVLEAAAFPPPGATPFWPLWWSNPVPLCRQVRCAPMSPPACRPTRCPNRLT